MNQTHWLKHVNVEAHTSRITVDFFSVQRLHGFRQVVTHVQSQQTDEL